MFLRVGPASRLHLNHLGTPPSLHHDFLGMGPGYLQFDTLLKWLQALQVSDHCINPFPLHEPICLSEAAGTGPRSPNPRPWFPSQ